MSFLLSWLVLGLISVASPEEQNWQDMYYEAIERKFDMLDYAVRGYWKHYTGRHYGIASMHPDFPYAGPSRSPSLVLREWGP